MGAYVSTANCQAHYGVSPNCSMVLSKDNSTAILLGEVGLGQFPGDPDIAGIGVLGAFLCVTVMSLLLAIVSLTWWTAKNILGIKNRLTTEEKQLRSWQISITGIIEALLVSCSDQQVFTGGAYAVALRYSKACSVSAYHYNIVANILLVTFSTHLMALTTARHYWQHPYLAGLRITVVTLLIVLTGILLSNQGSSSLGFPTEVPPDKAKYSLMLLPAACFQTGDSRLATEVEKVLKAGSAKAFFTGQIHGWTNYIIMFLFYLVAVAVSLGRVIRRGMGHNGKRKRFIHWLKSTVPFFFRIKKVFYAGFGLYLFAGIALSAWTVAIAAMYVFRLRRWVDISGWIQRPQNRNPENDPSTFGQLVPLLLMSLTVFTFLQIISERIHARHKRAKRLEYLALRQHRSRPDSQAPSSRTHHSTISVVEPESVHDTDKALHHHHRHQQHRQELGRGLLYDYPYGDKAKSEPVVRFRAVGPEKAEAVISREIGIDGRGGNSRAEYKPRNEGDEHSADEWGGIPADEVAPADLEGGGDVEQPRWTTDRAATTAAGAANGGERPPSMSSTTSSKARKMGLLQRVMRTNGDKKRWTRGSGDDRGSLEGQSLESGPGTELDMEARHSAMNLPIGIGSGFPAQARAGIGLSSRRDGGEWFVPNRR